MLLELGVVTDHQVDDSHAAAAGLAAHAPGIKPRAYDRVGAENLLRDGLHRRCRANGCESATSSEPTSQGRSGLQRVLCRVTGRIAVQPLR
jgi:hypothetical protein